VERQPWPFITATMTALALDPVRSGLSLLSTAIGVGERRFRTRGVMVGRRHFSNVGPTERLDADSSPARWFSALVERLDGRRMRKLAKP
jgi:hypothetical protein